MTESFPGVDPLPVAVVQAMRGAETIFHYGGTCLWTSGMFPWLEPYTENHRRAASRALGTTLVKEAPPPVSHTKTLYMLMQDFTLVWLHEGSYYRMVIPAGFVTDIASVPIVLQLPPLRMRSDGPIRVAALAHDLGYQFQGDFDDTPAISRWIPAMGRWVTFRLKWPKSAVDKMFAKIMKAYRTPLGHLAYLGVRWGGHIAWHRKDPARHYTRSLYRATKAARARIPLDVR